MPKDEYRFEHDEKIEQRVCDYIAGMTDRYAIGVFENLFIPKVWKLQ
jgi:dGTPase